MKKDNMTIINNFFNECAEQTVDTILKDNKELRELGERTRVSYFIKYDGGEREIDNSYIPNISEYRKATYSESYYMKGVFMYKSFIKEGVEASDNVKDWLNRMNDWNGKKNQMVDRYPKDFLDAALRMRFNREDVEKVVGKYFNSKKKALLDNLAKRGGEVFDAEYLHYNMGILNGLFICENGNVKVETIFAGGYNIQCLHIRTLVKLLKNTKKEA